MEPNNNPMNPVTPQPQQPVVPISPMIQPITAPPVFDPPQPQPQPFQMTQQPQMMAPVPPIQPINSPVFESAPTYKTPTGNKKLIIIGAIVTAVILLIAGIMIIPNMITASSLPLEEFSNDKFSMLVPKSYDQPDDKDSSYLTFSEPFTEAPDDINDYDAYLESIKSISSINVNYYEYSGSKSNNIKEFDDMAKESSLENQYSTDNNQKIENFKIDKSKRSGNEARIISADLFESKKLVRKLKMMVIFAEDEAYMVTISADSGDAGLIANINTIIGSFKIKK